MLDNKTGLDTNKRARNTCIDTMHEQHGFEIVNFIKKWQILSAGTPSTGVTLALHVGASGLVDRASDSRLKGVGFDSHCWSCVEVSDKLLISYCLCLLAVMDTWGSRFVTEWLKLLAYLHGLCTVFSQGIWMLKWCVSYTREGNG